MRLNEAVKSVLDPKGIPAPDKSGIRPKYGQSDAMLRGDCIG